VNERTRLGRFVLAVTIGYLGFVGGCKAVGDFLKIDMSRFMSPDKVIKADGSPINPILPSIGPVDTAQELVPNSAFPLPEDLVYTDEDYVIGPTDILEISVLSLFQDGLETVLSRQVAASGYIELPYLTERLKASGHTQEQLKDMIVEAYIRDEVLREDPRVSVSLMTKRQSTFSVLGAVARPGTYNIVRKDMRLLEALSHPGGVSQTNIRYIYVIRQAPAIRKLAAAKPVATAPAELPPLPLPAGEPDIDAQLRELGEAAPGATPQTGPTTLPAPAVLPRLTEQDDTTSTVATGLADAGGSGGSKAYKWVFTDGRWIRVAEDVGVERRPERPAPRPVPDVSHRPPRELDPFGWAKAANLGDTRIIAIDWRKLRQGNHRMNIIIRDKDVIHVPVLELAEFYVMGEVLRPGVYQMMGRRITVKQAIAAAGNLGPLAWPENCILIRRIGDNKEQTIPLDMEAIFKGETPDLILKPNDLLAVGTDIRAIPYAVMRNAFRMTYGFGFIYDRNFADPYFYTLDSKRFTRW